MNPLPVTAKGQASKFDRIARAFVRSLNKQQAYPVFHRQKFYTYQGTRYAEEPELAQRVRSFMRDKGIGQSNNVVGNVLPIVHNLAHKSSGEHPEVPFYCGEDGNFPAARDIIAYRNGLLNVERHLAGEPALMPHTLLWVSPFCLPHDFDPDAACPNWLRFLGEVFEGDEDRVRLLQEWFGYCLTHDSSFQKFLWMKGPPGSGKGTAATVLRHLVGHDYSVGFSLYQLATSHGPALLVGKLVAVCGEVDLAGCSDKYKILECFKRITGNDPVEINQKHQPLYSTVLPTRFTILSNEHLNFVDHTGAVDRRMLPVNFDRVAAKPDPALVDKLLAEITGVNAWAMRGLARLKKNGRFTETAAGKKLRTETRRNSSHVFAFLQDCCVVQSDCDPGNLDGVQITDGPCRASAQQMKAAYLAWCEQHDVANPNMVNFGRTLASILPKVENKPDRVGGKVVRGYPGLGLLPDRVPPPLPPEIEGQLHAEVLPGGLSG